LNRIPTAQETSVRIDKWDYIELKGFFMVKEIIIRMKRQCTEREKTFASYSLDKE
jgi:hypothetical protein